MSKRPSADGKQTRVLRGSKEHAHDLFKLTQAQLKRNVSWRFKDPQVVEIEHTHMYHSINDTTFQPNKYCAPVAGHFHEVTVTWGKNEDGEDVIKDAKCGPPLQVIAVKAGTRSFRKIVPVVFERHHELGGDVVDDHRHDLQYIGSEFLTESGKQAARDESRMKVRELMVGQPVSTQVAASSKVEAGASEAQKFTKE